MALNIKGAPSDISATNRWALQIENQLSDLQTKAHNVPNVAAKVAAAQPAQNIDIALTMPKQYSVAGSPSGATGEFDVTWKSQPQFEVLLTGGNVVNPSFDFATGAQGSSSTPFAISTSPTSDSEAFLLLTASDGGSPSLTPPFSILNASSTSSVNAAFATKNTTTLNVSLGSLGADFAAVGAWLHASGPLAIVQKVLGSMGAGSSATLTFPNPVTAGNTIIVCAAQHNTTGGFAPVGCSVSDSLINSFGMLSTLSNGISSVATMFMCTPSLGGSDVVTVTTGAGPSCTIDLIAFELTGISSNFQAQPDFGPLTSPYIPPINLNTTINGGVTGILPVAHGGTGTSTPGLVAGTNVTITGSWPDQTIAAAGGIASINSQTGPAITIAAGTNVTVGTAANVITISASGGGGGGTAFQSLQRETRIAADGTNPATPTLNVLGDSVNEMFAPTKVGAIASSTLGPAVVYTPAVATATLAISGTVDSTGGNYITGKNIKYLYKGYWTTTGDGQLWMGMFNTPNTGNWGTGLSRQTDPGTTAQVSGAGFRCANKSGSSLETTWHAYVSNGSASTIVNTGVTQDTAEHTFAILFNDSTPNITFYIDGTLVATVSTTLPAAANRLSWFLGAWYTTTPVKAGFGYLLIDSDI